MSEQRKRVENVGRVSLSPFGDTGVRVGFGEEIAASVHRKVRAFCHWLQREKPQGVKEWVPAYASVTVYYDPFHITYPQLRARLEQGLAQLESVELPAPRTVRIPTCYGDVYGPDLPDVARHNGLTEEDVIRIHSSREYLIYMMGFVPGFPYLGGMSERIATPRLKEPRAKIPAGSVGIAGKQTGIYPLETPGGWRIIGRTPISLFDPLHKPPIRLKAGDKIRFVPIARDDYERLKREAEEGKRSGRKVR